MSAATSLAAWLGGAARAIGRPLAIAARWALRPVLKRRADRASLTERTRQFTRQSTPVPDRPPSLTQRVRQRLDALAAWSRPRSLASMRGPERRDFGKRRHRPQAIRIEVTGSDRRRASGLRNPVLAEELAHISAAARAIREATYRRAFRKQGGREHPTLNAAAVVSALGVTRAVEFSQLFEQILAARGPDYLVDPAAWASDNGFIRQAEARGWLVREDVARAEA